MTEYAGHYDHDVRVRFAEGLINRANDWQWLIDCTEECFEGPEEISSVREFLGSFSSVHDPYIFLASIVDTIDDVKLSFSTSWLEKLYKSVLLCRGLIQPEGYAEHVGFYGLLGVASYATCLFNKFAGTNICLIAVLSFIRISTNYSISLPCMMIGRDSKSWLRRLICLELKMLSKLCGAISWESIGLLMTIESRS